ncbi:hypothetical protein Bbelb_207690 [Branchiostoma belcheri]|nr:hypothetical protein Bbelb_207690 [Branchiostoma belcheri]
MAVRPQHSHEQMSTSLPIGSNAQKLESTKNRYRSLSGTPNQMLGGGGCRSELLLIADFSGGPKDTAVIQKTLVFSTSPSAWILDARGWMSSGAIFVPRKVNCQASEALGLLRELVHLDCGLVSAEAEPSTDGYVTGYDAGVSEEARVASLVIPPKQNILPYLEGRQTILLLDGY